MSQKRVKLSRGAGSPVIWVLSSSGLATYIGVLLTSAGGGQARPSALSYAVFLLVCIGAALVGLIARWVYLKLAGAALSSVSLAALENIKLGTSKVEKLVKEINAFGSQVELSDARDSFIRVENSLVSEFISIEKEMPSDLINTAHHAAVLEARTESIHTQLDRFIRTLSAEKVRLEENRAIKERVRIEAQLKERQAAEANTRSMAKALSEVVNEAQARIRSEYEQPVKRQS